MYQRLTRPIFGERCDRPSDDRPQRRWSPTCTGEAVAAPPEGGTNLALAQGEHCSISSACSVDLYCIEGTLWVTWPEYSGDAILSGGERLVISSDDLVLVSAMAMSSICIAGQWTVQAEGPFGTRRLSLRRPR